MNARRLYDLYADSMREQCGAHFFNHEVHGRSGDEPPPAWPFLDERERKVWHGIAKRIRTSARRLQ